MGLWEELSRAQHAKTASVLTKDKFVDFMDELGRADEQKARDFVMFTGSGGMKMIQNTMIKELYLDMMKKLNLSRKERKRLGEMINSSDSENFEVAKIIIDNKLKEAKECHK